MRLSDTFGITLTCQMRHQALWKLRNHFGTNAGLARYLGITNMQCGQFINLKAIPTARQRDKLAPKLFELGVNPDDLWPEELSKSKLIGSSALRREIEKSIPIEQLLSLSSSNALAELPYDGPSPEALTHSHEEQDKINEIIRTRLHPRSQKVIAMYFGLNGEEEKTCAEIGVELDLSTSRVSQLIHHILRKIRADKTCRKLAMDRYDD